MTELKQIVSGCNHEPPCSSGERHSELRAFDQLQRELDAAKNEAATCDDIKLDQPLSGVIHDLQQARALAERERDAVRGEKDKIEAWLAKIIAVANTGTVKNMLASEHAAEFVARLMIAEQQKTKAMVEAEERADQAEAILVQLREQAVRVLRELMKYTPRKRWVGGIQSGRLEPQGEALMKVLDDCDSFLSLPLPSSAERISKVFKAAEETVREYRAHSREPLIALEEKLEPALREWKEAG